MAAYTPKRRDTGRPTFLRERVLKTLRPGKAAVTHEERSFTRALPTAPLRVCREEHHVSIRVVMACRSDMPRIIVTAHIS